VSESLLLSLVFIGIIVLIGYIGAAFGVGRGFLATASILIGAEAALWWGNNLGQRLSDWIDISHETGNFVSGVLLLFLTVLLLGVLSSLVLGWGTPTRWGALLGAALGAANGALLIAMALRLYYLAYSGTLASVPLDDSIVTRVLWRNFDWFILAFIAIASVLLLYTRFARLAITVPDPVARTAYSRPIPPPVPRQDPRGIPNQSDARYTTASHSRNGASPAPHAAERADDAIYAPPPSTPPATQSTVVERTTVVEVEKTRAELPSARNTVRFCPNCGMTLDASDRFCPDCGFTL
jgi:hypothetical protein